MASKLIEVWENGTSKPLDQVPLTNTEHGLRYDEAYNEKHSIWLNQPAPDIEDEGGREDALKWFQLNANLFVNAFRPRIERYKKQL